MAMACDQIVMHPRAVLGGPGAYQMIGNEIRLASQTVREHMAPRKGRSWSLWNAMRSAARSASLHAARRSGILLRRRTSPHSPSPAKPRICRNGRKGRW